MNLRQKLSLPTSLSAFTMVELLIVIAIIALLAVAVLATLNPIEQLNKARDTSRRTNAGELVKASERFFAVHEMWPWNEDTATGGAADDWDGDTSNLYVDITSCGGGIDSPDCQFDDSEPDFSVETDHLSWIALLRQTEEVKDRLADEVYNDGQDWVAVKDEDDETFYVCFQPSSEQFRQEAVNNCQDGNVPTDAAYATTICPIAAGSDASETELADNPYLCMP